MKKILFLCSLAIPFLVQSQISLFHEFKGMPSIPVSAQDAYKSSKVDLVEGRQVYVDCGAQIAAYMERLKTNQKPFADLASAPAKGSGGSNFTDLNTPEMKAKLAKMNQEEKIKFLTEIQARNQSNSQRVSSSPVAEISAKLNASGQALIAVLREFRQNGTPAYEKCGAICTDSVKDCPKKIAGCESEISRVHYSNETGRFAGFSKQVQAAYNLKKAEFEKNLKDFDSQTARYAKEETAADYSAAFVILNAIAEKIKSYEKAGAEIIIGSKNDKYSKNSF